MRQLYQSYTISSSYNETIRARIGYVFEKPSFVDVFRIISIILVGGLVSLELEAQDFEGCLNFATAQQHRLEKEDTVKTCFNRFKTKINKNECYSFLNKKVKSLDSIRLNEEITSVCFYETSKAPDLNSCMNETKKFKSSNNHDEAVFYCYQQFQEKLSKADCLKTANQLIFPLKKEYLTDHCNNNSN